MKTDRPLFYPIILAGLLILAPLVHAQPDPNRAANPTVQFLDQAPQSLDELTAPLVCWSEILTEPRPLRIHFCLANLLHPDLEVCTLIGDDPDGEGPAESTLTSPLDLFSRAHALAAVNANAFAGRPGVKDLIPGWYPGKWVDIQGLAVGNYRPASPTEVQRPAFWLDGCHRPHFGQPPAEAAIFCGVANWYNSDLILRDGQVVPAVSSDLHPRTVLALDAAQRWLILAVIDGRRPGYSEGVTLHEAAAMLQARGGYNAINLDGGGSSVLLAAAPEGVRIVNRPSGTALRPIPVMIGVRPVDRTGDLKTLTVMTWNIHHGAGLDDRLDLERIAAVIRQHHPDVVGLNEVDCHFGDRSQNRDQARLLADRLDMHLFFGPGIIDPATDPPRQYGNAILSRFPILRAVNHALPVTAGHEPRACLQATLLINRRPVDFLVTHLDHLSSTVRLDQARFIAALSGENPRILMGDFNEPPTDSGVLTCLADGLTPAYRLAGVAPEPTIGENPAAARKIDYILTGPGFQTVLACQVIDDDPARIASDHRPLLVRLQLPSSAP